MRKTFGHVFFDENDRIEIIRRLENDPEYLKLNKEYEDRIKKLYDVIRALEDERSTKRKKLLRHIQWNFCKEKLG